MEVKEEKNELTKSSKPAVVQEDDTDELDLKAKKYLRGNATNLEVLQDKKLIGQLAVKEKLYGQSAKAAAKTEKWLMPCEEGFLKAEGLEKTWSIKQEDILKEVDRNSSRKPFDMILPDLAPYTLGYTTSGRYMMVGGRKGHLAMIDMISMDLIKEFQVRETVRDVVFLQNEQFFAAAQKKYLYIYDRQGTEIHCLKDHGAPLKLQYLDKHFLLTSINKFGQLHYQDISTGAMVANYRTGHGRTDVMRTNPYNSIIGVGHSGGKVTMWRPTSSKPLVTMLCHRGPVSSMAFHSNGHLMATAGVDRKIKLWDLRKYEVIRTYTGRAQTLDFSQKGLLAMANGSRVDIWRDSFKDQNYRRYMRHSMVKGCQVGKVCFRPYEDVLGIGHSMGVSSVLVPGSGEPNFDTWVANPYETKKQRREKEVRSLLDKLRPETIMVDPSRIGTVKPLRMMEKELEAEMEEAIEGAKSKRFKTKTKGRSKPSKMARRREEEVFRAKRQFVEEKETERQALMKKQRVVEESEQLSKSLQRFARKKAT